MLNKNKDQCLLLRLFQQNDKASSQVLKNLVKSSPIKQPTSKQKINPFDSFIYNDFEKQLSDDEKSEEYMNLNSLIDCDEPTKKSKSPKKEIVKDI